MAKYLTMRKGTALEDASWRRTVPAALVFCLGVIISGVLYIF